MPKSGVARAARGAARADTMKWRAAVGSFYTNVALKGTTQEAVLAHLRAQGRDAYVARTIGDVTVVYDLASESQDIRALTALAADLSRAFTCPALATLVHDDDFLVYSLFKDGAQVDEYNSDPSYFEGDDPTPPGGGDASALCATFGVETAAVARVEAILRAWPGPDGDLRASPYLFAQHRHRDLARVLGLPVDLCLLGYMYVEQGEAETPGIVKTLP
jgi:hypothetical protein